MANDPAAPREPRPPRRRFLRLAALGGAGAAVFGRALVALAGEGKPTAEMVRQAEWVSGLAFTDEERALLLEDLADTVDGYAKLRALAIDNAVAPAILFRTLEPAAGPPAAGGAAPPGPTSAPSTPAAIAAAGAAARSRLPGGPGPLGDDAVAYATVRELASWVRRRKISPQELLRVSLDRMERLDGRLLAVVNRTLPLARAQAKAATAELAAGRWRGPLHGLPWGAKDLVAVPGTPTTWGSRLYVERERPERATVFERLSAHGAVLAAKTTVGELAMDDVWFGGQTRNPWRPDEGSSGSSAGSAAGVAAGYFPFAIGTETWGSIVSPATRCGVTGLRPTFGRVSRHGVMALAWTMDKVGVLARSATCCGEVLAAIHGADPRDPTAVSRPFPWPPPRPLKELVVGVPEALFEASPGDPDDPSPAARARAEAQRGLDRAALEVLRGLGLRLVPFALPDEVPVPPLASILLAEGAAAFDALLRTGEAKALVRQGKNGWPNWFRQGELVPAVEYLRAMRARTLLQRAMEQRLAAVDLFVAPSFAGDALLLTNLTGHPSVTVPDGFRPDGTPGSLTFTGRLHGEAEILQVAEAYQEATGFHRRRPPLG